MTDPRGLGLILSEPLLLSYSCMSKTTQSPTETQSGQTAHPRPTKNPVWAAPSSKSPYPSTSSNLVGRRRPPSSTSQPAENPGQARQLQGQQHPLSGHERMTLWPAGGLMDEMPLRGRSVEHQSCRSGVHDQMGRGHRCCHWHWNRPRPPCLLCCARLH